MDYRIILVDLPPGENGCIVKKDDFCTILINARLTADQQREAALHEIAHFNLGHMDDIDTPVRIKESEVKKQLPGVKNGQLNCIEEWNQ